MLEQIGRYTILRKIGMGSTATVFLGEAGEEKAAIKVLHRHLVLDEVVMERFRREVAIARELIHDGIIRIFDFLSWQEQAALVMEYCAGGNLSGCRFTGADEVVTTALQVARALAFAHARGIIHRDLKPENILKDSRGRIKICDFGSAHVQNLLGITTSTMFTGTPQFVAPELLAGNFADPRSDLYSLGAVLYQGVTGKPHRGTSVISLIRKQEGIPSTRAFNPGIPEWLDALILNLLDDVDKRIPDAETLVYLLENRHAPGVRETKSCLYCKSAMLTETTRCLQCGKAEPRLEPYYGADAKYLVLKKIGEKAETMHHFVSILQALSGVKELEIKFITGDARLYSKEEKKSGITMPVRVLDNLSGAMVKELIPLLEGPYKTEIALEIRAMKDVKKTKRGPLIQPRAESKRAEAAEDFLACAAIKSAALPQTESQLLFHRITEAGYLVLKKMAAAAYSSRVSDLLTQLLDSLQAACRQMNTLEEYLNTVSLGAVYNEWVRVDHLLKKSMQPGEIQQLLERKQAQQRIYEKYQQQEKRYADTKNKILTIYGKLILIGKQWVEQEIPEAALHEHIKKIANPDWAGA